MSSVPYISIQPNYPQVFSDVSSLSVPPENIWLSLYSSNAPSASIHSKLLLTPCKEQLDAQTQPTLETQGGINLEKSTSDNLSVRRVKGSHLDLLVSTAASSTLKASPSTPYRKLHAQISIPPTYIRFPKRSIDKVLPSKSHLQTLYPNANLTYPTISAFDISPTDNGFFVAGGEDGFLVVGNMGEPNQGTSASDLSEEQSRALDGELGQERRIEVMAEIRIKERKEISERDKRVYLKGHVGDIRSAKFFPSGQVVLSTASDLTSRIFSATDGSNPRTLTGHKRAVLCSGILGKGREVLTGGGDGTVRLYDVGLGKQKTLFGVDRFSSVNSISLPNDPTDQDPTQHEQDCFAVGLTSGHVEFFDIRTRKSTSIIKGNFDFPPGPKPNATDFWSQESSGQVTCLDWHRSQGREILVTGSSKGVVAVHDLRMIGGSGGNPEEEEGRGGKGVAPRSLISSWKRNGSCINDLKFSDPKGRAQELVVATCDGLPYKVDISAILDGQSYEGANVADEAMELEKAEGAEDEEDYLPKYGPRVLEEFAGWDCDSTEFVRLDHKGRVVIAGSEARIRRY
ncbi:WD40 repeat-like protein [Violaceomyces palustris]|uniref:WD40 repeat-like protein n=1 Tax=Violaceomyces palustris TaxID=1673888 RepID=A0ACD0NZL7_9BASI|nr:WD40 repeat-like protein [Violaceomyces palustris]